MGAEINFTYEKDENGKHKVFEYKSGIKVRLLEEPSKKYKDKMEKNRKELAKQQAEKRKVLEKEKLIKDKMRELAIKELKKEGKI